MPYNIVFDKLVEIEQKKLKRTLLDFYCVNLKKEYTILQGTVWIPFLYNTELIKFKNTIEFTIVSGGGGSSSNSAAHTAL